MATESSTKKVVPKIVKVDKAFELAKIWVKNMSGGISEEKVTDVEIEGRPSRLGLGARVAPKAKTTPSTDPVERKLLSKVNAKRKQRLENEEKNEIQSEDDTDEPESRISAVAKKRPMPLPTAALVKRHK
ncbi:hypothetical protein LUZ63_011121 [Rhynchospora breviuscula]|uniref:Uncharacterized protein n=1 Tax=Rhynchospora breviuscula TaxID=2022672 RepID=A0A9Q0HQN5_9POAL|nr:hypothetical protein LUZ63_011121 [Rhynchospora breviuscula]